MERISSSVSSVRATAGVALARSGAVVVFVVLTLMLIAIVIAYLVWRVSRDSLRAVNVMKDVRRLNGRPAYRMPASRLPAMYTGQQYTFSFWLYLTDLQATNQHKLLLTRTGSSSSTTSAGSLVPSDMLRNANPVVFLDRTSNRLHIAMRTNRDRASPATTLDGLLAGRSAAHRANWSHLVATVDYVPTQSWINIAFSVRDSLLTVFMDGRIFTVESLSDMPTLPGGGRPQFASCIGDVLLGNVSTLLSGDVKGFMSRVQFFNYALTADSVSKLYNSGPTARGALNRLGIPDYGVRSPIYKLDDASADDEDYNGRRSSDEVGAA